MHNQDQKHRHKILLLIKNHHNYTQLFKAKILNDKEKGELLKWELVVKKVFSFIAFKKLK